MNEIAPIYQKYNSYELAREHTVKIIYLRTLKSNSESLLNKLYDLQYHSCRQHDRRGSSYTPKFDIKRMGFEISQASTTNDSNKAHCIFRIKAIRFCGLYPAGPNLFFVVPFSSGFCLCLQARVIKKHNMSWEKCHAFIIWETLLKLDRTGQIHLDLIACVWISVWGLRRRLLFSVLDCTVCILLSQSYWIK